MDSHADKCCVLPSISRCCGCLGARVHDGWHASPLPPLPSHASQGEKAVDVLALQSPMAALGAIASGTLRRAWGCAPRFGALPGTHFPSTTCAFWGLGWGDPLCPRGAGEGWRPPSLRAPAMEASHTTVRLRGCAGEARGRGVTPMGASTCALRSGAVGCGWGPARCTTVRQRFHAGPSVA